MSIFEEKINSLVEEFSNKAENEINSGKYNVATPQPSKPVIVNALKIKSALKILFSSSKSSLTEDIVLHFKELERLIPFSSTPKAFHSAWDLRSKNLNKFAADRLANEGAQLIPLNSISNIFGIRDQQGVMLGPNKRLVMGIRHSIGNYDDKLDDLRFTYQPPRKLPGMLRYRWCEFISTKLKIPFTILAAIWLMYSIDEKTKIPIFIVTPVQIINPEKNLNNLNNSLKNPLELQIVSRAEVYTSIHRFNSLQDTDTEINFRNDLDVRFSEEWSFEEIHSSKKGKEVKKWYKDNGKRCPGNICDHIQFGELSDSEIELEKDNIRPVLGGSDIKRYKPTLKNKNNIIYTYYFKNGKQESVSIDLLGKKYPLLFKYLNKFKKELIDLKKKYKMNPINWHHLHRPRRLNWFEQEKIITPQISLGCNMTLDQTGFLHMDQVYSFIKKSTIDVPNEYFLGILNSKLLWFFIKSTSPVLRGGYYSFKSKYLELFHFPKYVNDKFQKKIIKNVKQIIEFEKIHQDNSEIDEKEILQKERLEKEIDEIVYSLYELDDDEKKIVDDNYPSFTKKKQ